MGAKFLVQGSILIFVLATVFCVPAARASVADAAKSGGYNTASVSLGYLFADTQDNFGRAGEYTRFKDSPTAGIKLGTFLEKSHFYLDGSYLNDADYTADTHFDYGGLVRFGLLTESLYHNLDHIPYPDQTILNPVTGATGATISDQDPGARYHVEVGQTNIHGRVKLGNYPAHVNLNYWRLERSGAQQLRYLEESCTGCHQHSRTQSVDRVTQEFTGSVDAHLGPVDLIVQQLVRVFTNDAPTPVDPFLAHRYRTVDTALLQHDETPDSRLVATTVQAHTSFAGGFNAAGEVTVGTRTNKSDLTAISPVEAKTDFTKTAGDMTYVPSPNWTFNLRYRLLDLDNRNASSQVLLDLQADPNVDTLASVDVRPSMDLKRSWYAATGSWRPNRSLTLKADYQREDIERSETGPVGNDGLWDLPDRESRSRYRLSTYVHPRTLRPLKVRAWYQFRTTDDPAYGTTVARGHQGFASLTWAQSAWGLNLTGQATHAKNNDHHIHQELDEQQLQDYRLGRRSDDGSVSVGLWYLPGRSLSVSLNYGYFSSRVLQDLLFGMDSAAGMTIRDDEVKYTQRVHTATAVATWRILESLSATVEGRYSVSKAHFNPGFATVLDVDPEDPGNVIGIDLFPVDSSQLRELSALDIRQAGVQLGVNWQANAAWNCSARYSFDDYADRLSDTFDGTAHTIGVSIARAW